MGRFCLSPLLSFLNRVLVQIEDSKEYGSWSLPTWDLGLSGYSPSASCPYFLEGCQRRYECDLQSQQHTHHAYSSVHVRSLH